MKRSSQVREWLENPAEVDPVVDHNYRLGREHFSYSKLAEILGGIMAE